MILMTVTRNTDFIYNVNRKAADFLRIPLNNWRSHGSLPSFVLSIIFKAPVMAMGLIASLPFRKLSIWTHPGVVETTTEAESKQVANETTILSYNILGMPSFHAAKEKRPGINERIAGIFSEIRRSNADIVMLQEVHAGSYLEEKIIAEFKREYKTIYSDLGPATLFLGSGLMILTKLKDTQCVFHPFESSSEFHTVKGFAVLSVKGEEGKEVIRIANTHLQAGAGKKIERIRRHQAEQILREAEKTLEVPFVFGGDLNSDRLSDEYSAKHPLHHKKEGITDGFDEETRNKPTFMGSHGDKGDELAFDNIIGVNIEGKWNLSTQISEPKTFNNRTSSPSDHAALLATLTRKR